MKQKIEIEVDVPDDMEIKCQGTRNDICPVFAPDECTGQIVCNVLLRRKEAVRESRWVNVYENSLSSMFRSRAAVNSVGHTLVLKGVIRLDYEDGKLVSVTLEEVSDG